MEPVVVKKRGRPEKAIQAAIVAMLEKKGWFCKKTHGSVYQDGFPDLFCCHRSYGQRWIEVKNTERYRFTAAQLRDFPMFNAHGVGVWVLQGADESEYLKLFKPQNWYVFLS